MRQPAAPERRFRRCVSQALLSSVLLLAACASTAPSQPFASAALGRAEAASVATAWEERDLHQLQEAMAAGEIDSTGLVRYFHGRIVAIDRDGPRLNAIMEINPDALVIAAERDLERAGGHVRGPLHGIPVLLKDNIDTDDDMSTSAGSLALATHRPGRDATLVRNLRDAGAVILGKTNLSEWANFRSTRATSGWSARGGQTRNPHVLDRNPCGSSSGSAVAVAAGLAPLAVGTETDGSIVCPAAANRVVGIKPSVGVVSRHGLVPISRSQDTAGPLARNVTDAALLLQAMAGSDEKDAATLRVPAKVLGARALPLAGARIGVLREHFGLHPGLDALMDAALERLAAAGATIVDPVSIATHGKFGDAEWLVLLYEFHHGLNAYLSDTKAPVASLAELVDFNRQHADRELRWFGQEIFEEALPKRSLQAPEYLQARDTARRMAGAEGIDATLAAHRLDALVAPTTGPAWLTDPVIGDHYAGGSSSAAAVAGYPNISLPLGQVHGLPVGISLMGAEFDDARLISLAAEFERVLAARRPPGYLRSVADGREAAGTADRALR